MAAIKLEKVQKWFGDVKVIPELDLEIAAGDFLVLVGPSGCGKTTTMRMIAGLEDVSGGRILIEGQDVTGLAPSERGLSMVFQSYALYPHMTVAENMGFGLKNLGAPADAIQAKVAEAAAILRLDQLLERRPKALSGGQRQRVAIGRAIVREPKAFLFDEPLSNLDAALRVEMRFEIGRLHRQLGKTMIYVTHDQVEAMTLADKIVLMDKGEIVQAGTPRDLYERPANLFAARFIGSPRMNILPCELQGGRYVHKDVLAGEHRLPEDSEAAWLGIRPEHIELVAAGDGTASCRGKVELVEYLGAETYVYVGCPGLGRVTVRTDEYLEGAEEIGLHFDPKRTHFFDKDERAVS
ncbi:MAG: ABC transporter ATP-binding protein [Betaproteobacteria bacterium AqS2]|uniref:ABC transporter ATP-binding protein n=1 Tax=Candidatus Amphirhobacter heronislandensis TaxID=1732024 RepID=A0A930UIH6_9GAMM|nr:ABC transporter ATP-binding protein [Betaproteobacteria bacterium AqS2]